MCDTQKLYFQDNGYLIVEDLVSKSELQALVEDTTQIFRGKYGMPGIMPISDDASDEDALKNYLCVHMPHKFSDVQMSFVHHAGIVEALTRLIGPNVKCMQSMLFVKPPGFPGQAWHQDEKYIPTEDKSLTGAWIAIDDATTENGCLWVVPGSHKEPLREFGPQPDGDEYDGTGLMSVGVDESKMVPCEMRAGSVVFFNGYLLHQSLKNRSHIYRRALVSHYMNADSQLPWCGKDDYRDIILVAGEDRYAGRGIEELSQPYLRPVSRPN